jgi:8-amino-7-oxononanoate synthase
MSFNAELKQRLAALREQHLFRELRRVDSPQSPHLQIAGSAFLNFSSNDYLGLANHPVLKEAAIKAIEKYGAGSGASRLVCGSLAPFHELEAALAQLKKTKAALVFSTGYAAALGCIGALLGRDDIIILDKLVHACIVDAAKLSGAKIRVFAHNDLEDLEDKLKWAANSPPQSPTARQVLIVTESIFSMDGDAAPLREIVALKAQYGAWLMVDEAHATGIFGTHGGGLAEELGVGGIDIQMATLGKALGASGGCICGPRALIDLLINRARSFIFSTAPSPATAAAATAAIRLAQSSGGAELRRKLHANIAELHSARGVRAPEISSPIIPLILGDETKAVETAAKLREQGIFVPAIRYPSVARGAARLRVTLTAPHSSSDIGRLAAALRTLGIEDKEP